MKYRHLCPECSSERIRYQNFGPMSRDLCSDCGWVDWDGRGPRIISDPFWPRIIRAVKRALGLEQVA